MLMGKNLYSPSDNYERNILLVKRFGGKLIVFAVPLMMFLDIVCIAYLTFVNKELMEITLFKLITSKRDSTLDLHGLESSSMVVSCVVLLFFLIAFLGFFLKCKDPDEDALPNFSLTLLYNWSVVMICIFSVCFAAVAFFLVLFVFKDPEYFKDMGEWVGFAVSDIKAYKTSIIFGTVVACAMIAMFIWFSQSQAEFIKSIKLTLTNSVAQNKGAHTFSVFSIAISAALFCGALAFTFLYQCYKDSFKSFGIEIDSMYVYVSLARVYIRALIPFFISLCAYSYSEMVDEANSIGTMYYSHYDTIGEVTDPNMERRKK